MNMQENLPNANNASAITAQTISATSNSTLRYEPLKSVPLNPWLSQKVQILSVLVSYLLARLYLAILLENLPGWAHSWGYPVFTAAFLAWGSVIFTLRERAGAPKPETPVFYESIFWAVCTFAISLALCFGLGSAAGIFCGIFWHGFAVYWVLCRGGLLKEKRTGPFFAWDAFCAICIVPFGGFFLRIRTLWQALVNRKKAHRSRDMRTFWLTLLCIAVALPVFFAAVSLLTEADSGFAAFLNDFRFHFTFSEQWINQILFFVLSLPVGAYFYGLIGGSAAREPEKQAVAPARKELEKIRCVPKSADVLILAAFCILYFLFFVVQAGYLFSAFTGKLPAGFTPAEYARQGFYQLCWILVLNFGLLTVCAKMSAQTVRTQVAVKVLCVILMAASLLFCATAFSKLALYIACFGFTPRRLLSAWAMTVFAAGSILAASSIIRPHKAIGKLVWFASASFVVLCFIP